MGLGRRRERTERKTTQRVCHAKEIWGASAEPLPTLAKEPDSQPAGTRESIGTGISPNASREVLPLACGCYFTGDITVATSAAVQSGSRHRPSFCHCDGGKQFCWFDAGTGTVLPWACACRLQNWDGSWAGVVGASRENRLSKWKTRLEYTPCCN